MNYKIQYKECDKGAYHYGEAMNVVCLENTCLDVLGCSACI